VGADDLVSKVGAIPSHPQLAHEPRSRNPTALFSSCVMTPAAFDLFERASERLDTVDVPLIPKRGVD
jgi:hypothetical protein